MFQQRNRAFVHAFFHVSLRVAKAQMPHTIAEKLVEQNILENTYQSLWHPFYPTTLNVCFHVLDRMNALILFVVSIVSESSFKTRLCSKQGKHNVPRDSRNFV